MRFNTDTLASEVVQDLDLSGKICLITGGSSGLGKEAARCLAARGAQVIIVASTEQRGEAAVSALRSEIANAHIEYRAIRFDSLQQVAQAAEALLQQLPRIDVLIASAGIMATDEAQTDDGYERQFGINHLAHHLLITRLLPLLQNSGQARVVMLTSGAHRLSDVDLEDPLFQQRPYDRWLAYGQSKTANVLFANALDHLVAEQGIRALSVAPGVVAGTHLHDHLTDDHFGPLLAMQPSLKNLTRRKTTAEGAATMVWAAVHPQLEGCGQCYLEDCQVAFSNNDPLDHLGVMPYVRNMQSARQLWTLSERLIQAALNRVA